jgi:dynein heavy chain
LYRSFHARASQADIKNTLPTPVYVTQTRRDAMGTGLVFEANLAIRDDPGRWILQEAALFLNDDH